jgi:hypothetical protein
VNSAKKVLDLAKWNITVIFIISWLITREFKSDLQMLHWASLSVCKDLSRHWNGTCQLTFTFYQAVGVDISHTHIQEIPGLYLN